MHIEDGLLGSVLAEMMADSHRAGPRDVPALVWRAGRRLGLSQVWIYLADVQQQHLVALPTPGEQIDLPGAPQGAEALDIDGSLAGRAYRTQAVQLAPAGADTHRVVWMPLVDGIGRLGVLRISGPVLDETLLRRCESLAALTAMIVVTKTPFSDVFVTTGRSQPMTLQAELLWAFIPPRTIGTSQVTSSAVLEPAHDLGGDAFDHNLANHRLHFAVMDAMGHDLASGGASAAAMAAYRCTRRAGGTLADIAGAIDAALVRWIPDRLLTCVIAELDVVSGRLTWTNCGHPPPLLIRGRRVVDHALERSPHLPLGLATGLGASPPQVHTAQLEPGDRVLVHTDGVTEARDLQGELFGEQQLTQVVVRAMSDGLAAAEALRRLVHKILAHQGQGLRDDATILLVEWHPDR
ncbi:PP2C family protein-serine/threonine phosphatase [Kitasatospora indigofera]|uniref:PP2C family protein-serine/threonine phosphatase n=2 Tax=Kitasatospora indigofera TaxID=67307 RepID=UPI0036A1B0DE